jgi:hypothetical protein
MKNGYLCWSTSCNKFDHQLICGLSDSCWWARYLTNHTFFSISTFYRAYFDKDWPSCRYDTCNTHHPIIPEPFWCMLTISDQNRVRLTFVRFYRAGILLYHPNCRQDARPWGLLENISITLFITKLTGPLVHQNSKIVSAPPHRHCFSIGYFTRRR